MADPKKDDAYNLRKVFEQMELDLIANMRRNLKRHEVEEEKEGFRWEMWQKAKLRNLWKYRNENKEIVGKYSPEIEKAVRDALKYEYSRAGDALETIAKKVWSVFRRKGLRVPKSDAGRTLDKPARPENDFFGVNSKKVEALQEEAVMGSTLRNSVDSKSFHQDGKEKALRGSDNKNKLDDMAEQVINDLNSAQKAVWRRMDDVYRKTVYRAEMNMAAGTKTLDQAIDMATKEFLNAGINCIEYKNGRRVNIASYAEMALRTASQRAMLLAEGKKRDEWGIHTVVVSAHANTCPLCAHWQGKVLVDDVFSHGTQEEAEKLGYPLLSTAMKAGLLHPNCRHTLSTFFPGITKTPDIPDTEKALETYKAEQEQRAIEREIKKWKRIAEGSLDGNNVSNANNQVKQYQDEIQKLLDKYPKLRRDYSREKTRGIPTENKKSESAYGYENFDKEHLAKEAYELLPNFDQAIIPDAKLTGYALNKNHRVGKDKAIAFDKALGYNIDNKDDLIAEIYAGLKKYKASARAATKYGKPYEVGMIIKGANGKYAKIKTGWIIDNGTDDPRITTVYVDD